MVDGSLDATRLFRILQVLADDLHREAPLTQVLAFLRVAMLGEVDQGALQKSLGVSSAATSRTIQALSSTHYLKDRSGFDLVERAFDPTDNRRRTIRLTAKGRSVVQRLTALLQDSS